MPGILLLGFSLFLCFLKVTASVCPNSPYVISPRFLHWYYPLGCLFVYGECIRVFINVIYIIESHLYYLISSNVENNAPKLTVRDFRLFGTMMSTLYILTSWSAPFCPLVYVRIHPCPILHRPQTIGVAMGREGGGREGEAVWRR